MLLGNVLEQLEAALILPSATRPSYMLAVESTEGCINPVRLATLQVKPVEE